MKNYERLQKMTPEQLGNEICNWICSCDPNCPGRRLCSPHGPDANGIIKWLNQEAEEKEEN